MNYPFTILYVILISISFQNNCAGSVKSPDGQLCVTMDLHPEGTPVFRVSFKKNPVMDNNRLGLIREDADFSKNLQWVSTSAVEKVKDQYTLLHGKKRGCSYLGNRRVYHFINPKGEAIDIIFQVSNEGLAFRYYFPGGSPGIKRILDERTYFNFNDSTYAWIQPMSPAKSGWSAVNPSYEEHYFQEINISDLPPHEPGWVFPALFKSNQVWILLTETAPDRNYCGCRLKHDGHRTDFKVAFPQKPEVFPGGALNPESPLPWYTPWRIALISDNLGTLVESTLGTDLAKPSALTDIAFVKPGRSSWSWVLFKDDSTVYPVQKRFIDYASDMDWEYCLVDADWDRKIGYEKLSALCDYAESKGVGIFVWYNSAGDWNTTPYTPRDKLLTQTLREAEFTKLQEMGVKGVKVDFFGGDGQSMMSYYQDIIEDAARYRLMVNCHGSTIPRGWHRTYPNLVTMEAIKGFEFVTFEQLNADRQPSHCTVIPFTRNCYDPMDFTPVCFSEVPNIQRKTTNSFEMALSVLFLSGIQHFAEVPEGLAKVDSATTQLLKEIPVAWDESKFVDGYPGKHIVIARRKEKIWYVAGIHGEPAEKTLEFTLDFIQNPGTTLWITSGMDNRSFRVTSKKMNRSQPVRITLKPNDGFLVRISVQ